MKKTAIEFVDKEILEISSQLEKSQTSNERYAQAIRHLRELVNIKEKLLRLNKSING